MSMNRIEVINSEARKHIIEYCENRDLKCNGCRYAYKKVVLVEEQNKYCTCIWANCPRDWEEVDE